MAHVESPGIVLRHPLGLPPGSVRGILSLLIAIQFWLLLLLPDNRRVPIPLNLYLLMSLVALFFISHGKTIARSADPTPSPLYLPGGTLRILIFGGTVLVLIYIHLNHDGRLRERLQPDPDQWKHWPALVMAYVGGFTVGWIFRHMPFRDYWLFQSFLAWLSMISSALLVIEIVLRVFVQATLKEQIDFTTWEMIVTGITACYFGTRS